jgi:hypothetical protein
MTGDLYAFGSSHTAGHSLDARLSLKFLKQWYFENYGVETYEELYVKTNDKQREEIIHKFNKTVLNGKVNHPENSYASYLARNLSMSIKNFSVSGTGIDTVYREFQKQLHNINWSKDIVLIELPQIHRYKSEKSNIQYALDYNKKTSRYMPSLDSMEYFYAGIVSLFSKFPVHFINIMNDRHLDIKKYIEIHPLNTVTLMDMAEGKRYPSGHFWIGSHQQFADHLAEKL